MTQFRDALESHFPADNPFPVHVHTWRKHVVASRFQINPTWKCRGCNQWYCGNTPPAMKGQDP